MFPDAEAAWPGAVLMVVSSGGAGRSRPEIAIPRGIDGAATGRAPAPAQLLIERKVTTRPGPERGRMAAFHSTEHQTRPGHATEWRKKEGAPRSRRGFAAIAGLQPGPTRPSLSGAIRRKCCQSCGFGVT